MGFHSLRSAPADRLPSGGRSYTSPSYAQPSAETVYVFSVDGMSASSNSRDALLGSPNSHGSSGVFIPKSYGTGPIKVGDARRSEQVKSNHSGEVPHFVYHGLLDVPDSDDSDGFHHHNAESILAHDPMNGKSTLVATSFNVINGVVGVGMRAASVRVLVGC